MTTAPKRLCIKLFAENSAVVNPSQLVPIFQRWIQRRAVEGMLIDVADYKHVHHGPGLVLIAHEGDYAYNLSDNRPGMQYTLKQTAGLSLEDALLIILRRVLQAASQLQVEPAVNGLTLNTSELHITFLDRLNYPNDSEAQENARLVIESIVGELYGGDISVQHVEGDARDALRLQVMSAAAVGLDDLVAKTQQVSSVAQV